MGAVKEEYLPHYTYEEYAAWDGEWELIDGVPYAMAPAPTIRHQRISNEIARVLSESLEGCEKCQALLAVDWKIAEDTVVEPDNLVICHEPANDAYLLKAPALIFEILSPSTAQKDRGLKFELYEREGVGYYVIVDPKEEIAKVYHCDSTGHYVKVADVRNESVVFDLDGCRIDFKFEKIWR